MDVHASALQECCEEVVAVNEKLQEYKIKFVENNRKICQQQSQIALHSSMQFETIPKPYNDDKDNSNEANSNEANLSQLSNQELLPIIRADIEVLTRAKELYEEAIVKQDVVLAEQSVVLMRHSQTLAHSQTHRSPFEPFVRNSTTRSTPLNIKKAISNDRKPVDLMANMAITDLRHKRVLRTKQAENAEAQQLHNSDTEDSFIDFSPDEEEYKPANEMSDSGWSTDDEESDRENIATVAPTVAHKKVKEVSKVLSRNFSRRYRAVRDNFDKINDIIEEESDGKWFVTGPKWTVIMNRVNGMLGTQYTVTQLKTQFRQHKPINSTQRRPRINAKQTRKLIPKVTPHQRNFIHSSIANSNENQIPNWYKSDEITFMIQRRDERSRALEILTMADWESYDDIRVIGFLAFKERDEVLFYFTYGRCINDHLVKQFHCLLQGVGCPSWTHAFTVLNCEIDWTRSRILAVVKDYFTAVAVKCLCVGLTTKCFNERKKTFSPIINRADEFLQHMESLGLQLNPVMVDRMTNDALQQQNMNVGDDTDDDNIEEFVL